MDIKNYFTVRDAMAWTGLTKARISQLMQRENMVRECLKIGNVLLIPNHLADYFRNYGYDKRAVGRPKGTKKKFSIT